MTPDHINSGFELAAGLLLMLNVRRLYRDKNLRGVCIAPTALMVAWGCWNLYFYPHVSAWWSFAAGIPIVIMNTIWVGQMIYYRKEKYYGPTIFDYVWAPTRPSTCQKGTCSARSCQANQEAERCDVGVHGSEPCKGCDSECDSGPCPDGN